MNRATPGDIATRNALLAGMVQTAVNNANVTMELTATMSVESAPVPRAGEGPTVISPVQKDSTAQTVPTLASVLMVVAATTLPGPAPA